MASAPPATIAPAIANLTALVCCRSVMNPGCPLWWRSHTLRCKRRARAPDPTSEARLAPSPIGVTSFAHPGHDGLSLEYGSAVDGYRTYDAIGLAELVRSG